MLTVFAALGIIMSIKSHLKINEKVMRFIILILFFVISYPLYANNSYNTAEVDKFINEMFKKHNYEKDNLKKLFDQAYKKKRS